VPVELTVVLTTVRATAGGSKYGKLARVEAGRSAYGSAHGTAGDLKRKG